MRTEASAVDPTFFETPADLRAWLKKNHKTASELWVGYYKKATGEPSVTWEETVDEALCYGWIDSIRRSLDDEAYTIRFTPRKLTSVWSRRNIERAEVLRAEGLMRKAGLEAYAHRDVRADSGYAVGDRPEVLPTIECRVVVDAPTAPGGRRPSPPSMNGAPAMPTTTPEHDKRVAEMSFASVYPHYVNKVEKKGRTKEELHEVIRWLTGFTDEQIRERIDEKSTFEDFFAKATINTNAHLIRGVICGYRIEDIENPLTRKARYLDKLVDELARGRKMEKILRSQ